MSEEPEVLFERRGAAGIVTLNRPKALNALTLGMVRAIHPQLAAWAEEPNVQCVVIEAAGEKAFCAGGDIRALYDWGQAGDRTALDFWREEYQLNRFIKHYPKPYVALMDGINMGGGVGLSVHGSHRVATERLTFAMPETGIGLFPDVGGTYFLPRCPGETGLFLGLTGARIKAADAVYAGIADAYVPSVRLETLKDRLAGGAPVREALGEVAEEEGAAPLAELRGTIDRHFGKNSVAEILASLRADGGEWETKTADTIETKSPTSTLVAFRQIREGAALDFDACMKLEFRLINGFVKGHDFYEGVRAVVIDKDQNPKWKPETLSDMNVDDVDGYFEPLGADELTFG
ncbi:Enoyl-CoA hydratase/isomerase [Parvibaculum lavamentivorans DS-1]|uniref:3-hydroxyisobutyryl-CoA hydrolase n=1 Tax=Parvibaculum lavamentivorans (strain DS-1 / DSM 13023 / NCIMB 13966) TaxID=402881 RepID=A7HX73_PARL1|nr:enoyl-CoA hydratase/isomerase family protein [Parvibaculum lavamentivorans]ABS64506.1 Enoyl-CoA hydratase/isomerase [Parvibaculum lavamentivorans DS-1]